MDDKDPFEGFDEIEDNNSTDAASTSAASTASTPSRVSVEVPLTKFEDTGDDWDEGVDARDDKLFEAPAATESESSGGSDAYVRSKIKELATVQVIMNCYYSNIHYRFSA